MGQKGPIWRLEVGFLNKEFDIKTLVGNVFLQVGMKYEYIAYYFIGLVPVVSLAPAVAVHVVVCRGRLHLAVLFTPFTPHRQNRNQVRCNTCAGVHGSTPSFEVV